MAILAFTVSTHTQIKSWYLFVKPVACDRRGNQASSFGSSEKEMENSACDYELSFKMNTLGTLATVRAVICLM